MICIYCKKDGGKDSFKGREHILPSFLGKFPGDNPVLHECVCDECNSYFGECLDKPLAKDSIEGIARYRDGKKPKTPPKYERITFRIDKGHQYEGLYVVPTYPTGGAEDDIDLETQIVFINKRTQKRCSFRKNDIPPRGDIISMGFDQNETEVYIYGDQEAILLAAKEKGFYIDITEKVEIKDDALSGLVPVLINARIDRTIARGLSKILFNYLAYSLSSCMILNKSFDPIREYIRYDKGDQNKFFFPTTKPPLIEVNRSSSEHKWHCGHIILVERSGQKIFGKLSLSGCITKMSYDVTFCEDYSGIWFPLSAGLYFDTKAKKVIKLCPISYIKV